ncbi:MAG: ATP-grasp domain-containing protein [Alphaproteobacteria bacterium]|nr:ATP-grasp domain-containing protein [Alphaproteobacteria bacterium]
MKKVLLLCASHNDLGLIRGLRKLNYYIIATGNKDNLPGNGLVDKWIKADYSNQELILQIALKEKIDAICPCCNDYGVYTAAYIAEKLNLPGYDSLETTLTLHNKDKFKEFAEKHNILTPKSKSFKNCDDALEYIKTTKFPIIIKPSDASAGNGISKVNDINQAKDAIKFAFSKSKNQTIVIEPFLEGSQHGFCTYLVDQKVITFSSNNEYSIINPYRVEIDTFPSSNWEQCSGILIEQIEKIAKILNLKDGIFHLQYIYNNGTPWIIEVMRRVLGNMYSVPANKLNNIDWDYWEAKARCGLDCKDFPKNIIQTGYYAYKEIMSPKNGIIEKINIPQTLEKFKYDQFMLMNEGDEINDYSHQPVGFLFLKFSSKEEMDEVLIRNYRNDLVVLKEIG